MIDPRISSQFKLDAEVTDLNLRKQANYYWLGRADPNPSPKSHNLKAYFLVFQENGKASTNLGNLADYFFTDSLSGCTVSCGIGTNPLVIHYNYLSTDGHGSVDQSRIDSDISTSYVGRTPGVLRKADYKKAEDRGAAVASIRDKISGLWTFYYQVYDDNRVLEFGTV